MRRPLTVLLTCCLAFVLTGCKLDVHVLVDMANDGSGVVTVTAVADKELIESRTDLIEDLEFDDAIENGWEIGEPQVGADGSVTLVLSHSFANANELANVLYSVGPPLSNAGAARTSDGQQVTNGISGVLELPDGYGSFADSDLVTAAGGMPFADEFAASQVPISEGFSFTLDVKMPGRLLKAPEGTAIGDGTIRWVAPVDGQRLNFEETTVQRIATGSSWWARPLSWISLGLLIAWVVFSVGFIFYVARRRRQQTRTRQLALRNLSETRSPAASTQSRRRRRGGRPPGTPRPPRAPR